MECALLRVCRLTPQRDTRVWEQVCGSSWPSKSKLFKHIKQTGHAALKPM